MFMLANLLCQLFIKYTCKQTNPWGSNWKVFADFIEVCLLFICLLLVCSLLLRCWGTCSAWSIFILFYFPPCFLLSITETQERIYSSCGRSHHFSLLCDQKNWTVNFMKMCSLSCTVLSPIPDIDMGSMDSVPGHTLQSATMRYLSKN